MDNNNSSINTSTLPQNAPAPNSSQPLAQPSTPPKPSTTPRRISPYLILSLITIIANVILRVVLSSLSYSIISSYASIIISIFTQIFLILLLNDNVRSKYDHTQSSQPPQSSKSTAPNIILIILVILASVFSTLSFTPLITLAISYFILRASYKKSDRNRYLLNTSTIISLICGIIVLAAFVIPTLISKQMDSTSSQAFGLVLYLVYAPIYSIFRVEAIIPVIFSFILLFKNHKSYPSIFIRNLILTIISLLLVLSPVFYSITRRAIIKSDPSNITGHSMSTNNCTGVAPESFTYTDDSLGYYAQNLACAYLFHQYAKHTAPTTQADIFKYLPIDFVNALPDHRIPTVTIDADQPKDKYTFNILTHRLCSSENREPVDYAISVWYRDPSHNMGMSCTEIINYDNLNIYDLQSPDTWYSVIFRNYPRENSRRYHH